MPYTRHTISGVPGEQPQHIVDHPVFGQYLEVVPEGTKALTPGHFKQGTVEEREEAAREKAAAKEQADAEAEAKAEKKEDS